MPLCNRGRIPTADKLRADRIGTKTPKLLVLPETNVERILEAMEETKPDVAVIDSIQTIYSDDIASPAGSVTQIREGASRLIQAAKEKDICIFFIGHVTKDGQIAGPMTLEHMVDTVIYFEGDPKSQYRILRAIKNRFGATNEIGIFEMLDDGLKEVSNPSQIFLNHASEKSSGSVVTANLEGSRPLLIEVQALCSPSTYSIPTRITTGIDRNRVMLLIAILEKRLGIVLSNQDIYVNVTGGFRINERAGDLAAASAVLSSYRDKVVQKGSFFFGEIGLTGEIRGSRHPLKRILEGEKLGMKRCVLPLDNLKSLAHKDSGIELIGIRSIEELADKIF